MFGFGSTVQRYPLILRDRQPTRNTFWIQRDDLGRIDVQFKEGVDGLIVFRLSEMVDCLKSPYLLVSPFLH